MIVKKINTTAIVLQLNQNIFFTEHRRKSWVGKFTVTTVFMIVLKVNIIESPNI